MNTLQSNSITRKLYSQLILLVFILTTSITNAQIEVKEYNTTNVIANNQVLSFANAGCGYSDPCNWKFSVTNTSSENIYVKIFVDQLVNTDGSNFQLCFAGVCLNSVSLGTGYPSNAVMIAPGASNGVGNSMWNLNPASTSTPMSWVFRFQAFNSLNSPIGTPMTMTYSFDPSLSLADSEQLNVEVYTSQDSKELNIVSQEQLFIEFYNILGQKVKYSETTASNNTIDVSELKSQPYIMRISNNQGKKIIKKILIQ